ncbi:DUF1003 domain-containing protein [Terriglobus sp.]|uniref:DUF1003 domain-containing protein n=1 Tax=Terriglobus sp. TaxID=1889013 RepID=UPI003B007973
MPATQRADARTPQTKTHAIEDGIRSVVEMDRGFDENRTLVDRLADTIGSFSGSMWFVGLHVVWFTLWFLINTGVLRFVPRFDPYPFILLAMIVSVEGVLLSTFVLMKQNRMQQRSDARHQLDLQINLLSEKEVTKALQLLRQIAEKLDLPQVDDDGELEEMARVTSVDTLSERIQQEIRPTN